MAYTGTAGFTWPARPIMKAMSDAAVLVVESNGSLRAGIDAALRRRPRFSRSLTSSVEEATAQIADSAPDVILLDIRLPDSSAIELCRMVAQDFPELPVILLGPRRGEIDLVLALDIGAVDYVLEPIRVSELVARIEAALSKSPPPKHRTTSTTNRPTGPPEFSAGRLRFDAERREAFLDERMLNLSRREFDLLAILASAPGQLWTREELMDALWQGRAPNDSRTLNTHILRLRSKLEEDPAHPTILLTVHGVGYRLDSATLRQ